MMEYGAQDTTAGPSISGFEFCFLKASLIPPGKPDQWPCKVTCDPRCGEEAGSGGEGRHSVRVEARVLKVRKRTLIENKLDTIHF